jgi:pimeloyl-ACP methyl ester carboxylesterase
VRVGALEVEYEEHGSGDRPFVLVHGLSGSKDDFADVIEALGFVGRTLAVDQRGHGGTSNPGEGYSLDQLTADLVGFLDANEIDRCDLLGHSIGGMVALRLALAHPERVASLVLMDTGARWHAPLSKRATRAIGTITRRVPPAILWRLIRANGKRFPEPMRRTAEEMGPERYWERTRVKLMAMDPVAFGALLESAVEQQPLTDRLNEIGCPTLVIVGEHDQAFLEPCRELAEGITAAEFVVVDDSHHSPQIEATKAWLEAIHAHLERARA